MPFSPHCDLDYCTRKCTAPIFVSIISTPCLGDAIRISNGVFVFVLEMCILNEIYLYLKCASQMRNQKNEKEKIRMI